MKLVHNQGTWEETHDRNACLAMLQGALERHYVDQLDALESERSRDLQCLNETYARKRDEIFNRHQAILGMTAETVQGRLC